MSQCQVLVLLECQGETRMMMMKEQFKILLPGVFYKSIVYFKDYKNNNVSLFYKLQRKHESWFHNFF